MITTTRPFDPGLVIHHDPRNELYPLAVSVRSLERLPVEGPAPLRPASRLHRQYAYFDQGQTPACTGYGSVTLLATADPYQKPPLTGAEWYALNQAFDRAQGRDYADGGATVVAALEVGRQLGFYTEYRWATDMRTMVEAILHAPLVAGTTWFESMFTRDAEGIVRQPGPNGAEAGGHFYVLRGYDAHRDLWTAANTWGDGDYKIPGTLMYRLLKDGGEVAQPSEIKLPAKRAA